MADLLLEKFKKIMESDGEWPKQIELDVVLDGYDGPDEVDNILKALLKIKGIFDVSFKDGPNQDVVIFSADDEEAAERAINWLYGEDEDTRETNHFYIYGEDVEESTITEDDKLIIVKSIPKLVADLDNAIDKMYALAEENDIEMYDYISDEHLSYWQDELVNTFSDAAFDVISKLEN